MSAFTKEILDRELQNFKISPSEICFLHGIFKHHIISFAPFLATQGYSTSNDSKPIFK